MSGGRFGWDCLGLEFRVLVRGTALAGEGLSHRREAGRGTYRQAKTFAAFNFNLHEKKIAHEAVPIPVRVFPARAGREWRSAAAGGLDGGRAYLR